MPLGITWEATRAGVRGRLPLGAGERVLDGASCGEVAAAFALVVATEGRGTQGAAPMAPAPDADSTRTATSSFAPPLATWPGPLMTFRPVEIHSAPIGLGVSAGARIGAAPGVAPSLEVEGEGDGPGPLAVRVGLGVASSSRGLDPGSAGFQLWTLSVVAGPRWWPRPALRIELGMRLEVGLLRAVPDGLVGPAPAPQPWLALGPSALGAVQVAGPLWVGAEVSLLVPVHRPAFRVEPDGVVHQVSPLGAQAGARVGLHFW